MAVGPADQVRSIVIAQGVATIEGSVENLVAADADVTISGSTASVDKIFIAAGTLTLENGATIGDAYYAGTEVSQDDTVLVDGEIVRCPDRAGGLARGAWPHCSSWCSSSWPSAASSPCSP